jgi:hypothetical protein
MVEAGSMPGRRAISWAAARVLSVKKRVAALLLILRVSVGKLPHLGADGRIESVDGRPVDLD